MKYLEHTQWQKFDNEGIRAVNGMCGWFSCYRCAMY